MDIDSVIGALVRSLPPNAVNSDLYAAAHGLLLKQEYGRSIPFLEELCARYPASSAAQLLMSFAFFGAGRFELARRHAATAGTLSRYGSGALPTATIDGYVARLAEKKADEAARLPPKATASYRELIERLPEVPMPPQILDMHNIGRIFLPYVNWLMHPNVHQNSIDTDGYGFRHSIDRAGRTVTVSDFAGSEYCALFGGSAAFGVGSTGNGTTIPSRLAALGDGTPWLNFAIPASVLEFNLVSALFLRPMHARPRAMVLFAGSNELLASLILPVSLPQFGMCWHFPDMLDRMNGPLDSWIAQVGMPLVDGTPPAGRDIEETCRHLEALLTKTLRNFSYVAKGCGAPLYFILQPNALWMTRRRLSAAETAVFAALDRHPTHVFNTVAAIFAELYPWYSDMLARACARSDIAFVDANETLDIAAYDGRNFFVDRVHLTDDGYDLVSRHLLDGIL